MPIDWPTRQRPKRGWSTPAVIQVRWGRPTVIFIAIVAFMLVMGYLHGSDHVQRPGQAPHGGHRSLGRFGEPNAEPTPADVRPHQATTSHGLPS